MIRIIVYASEEYTKALRGELRKKGINGEIDVVGVRVYSASNISVNSPNVPMCEILFPKNKDKKLFDKIFKSKERNPEVEKIIDSLKSFKNAPKIDYREVEFIS